MGTYCGAEGTLNALGYTEWGESLKSKGVCVSVWLIHFAVQQKLTQHWKATLPPQKNNNDLKIKNSLDSSCCSRFW